MLVLAALLVWLCVHLKLTSKRDFGYGLPRRRFVKISLLCGAIGIATAGVGAAFLLLTHLRVGAPDFIPGAPASRAFSWSAWPPGSASRCSKKPCFAAPAHGHRA